MTTFTKVFQHPGSTRHSTQYKAVAVIQTNDTLIKGDDGGGLVNHRGEDVIEIERGGYFLADGEEGVQSVNLSLRLRQIGIVEGVGGLLAM